MAVRFTKHEKAAIERADLLLQMSKSLRAQATQAAIIRALDREQAVGA